MNFKLAFRPDENYYKEAYSEITSSLKFKKYEPLLGTIMVLFGGSLVFIDSNKVLGLFPFIFIGIGIYELFKSYWERNQWIKNRLESKILGEILELEFNETTIKHNGPFSNGELNWNGLKDVIKTKKGILLKPENGISIYLPYKLFKDSTQINFIMSKKST